LSPYLSDIVLCHQKEAENFRRLLRSPEVLQELDCASLAKAKGSKQLTWDNVFRFLQHYVQKEMESIQSSRSNVTATTLAIRQKKMAEVCSLIKYFIRYANKRGPRLNCSELLKHVTEVLQSSHCCTAYGENYSSILLKDILTVRKYWCDISQKQWQSLHLGLFGSYRGISIPFFEGKPYCLAAAEQPE
uniref:Telomere-length maintenance and DNA damage repair domain-containing protein n=1 Tax=Oryzias latipes TaxID=8090 RepID=A0A3P9IGX3_ORYLA